MRLAACVRLVTLAALLPGCGGGSDLLLPGAGEPDTVTVIQGNEQNGRVGEPLPQDLIAEVKDGTNRPVEGARVVFALTDAAPGASVAPDTATTDANGQVTASVVLGTRPGVQTGEVRALGVTGQPTAITSFTLNAVSENANGISLVSGDQQTAAVNASLAQPLVVQVADAFGNPIAGTTVTWTIEGGGSVSEASTTTGDDGLTSVTRTLGGTAGSQYTLASVEGLAGSPVTFTHTATAGSASGVTIVSGNGQSGPVSTELPQALGVQVRDAASNPVPNVAVTWVVGSGGGSVTPTTSTTDANGVATAAWTLGPAPGTNTLSAVVSGIGVAGFTATAVAGAPARLSVVTQPSATAVSGVPLAQQPVVQLLDSQGNPSRQSGVAVTVSIGSGGGSLLGGTTASTDGEGRATFGGLALVGTGGTHTLRFTADGFAAVTSSQISLTAASTVTTITSDSPDPSDAGAQVTVQFTVSSAAGTPTGSVRVSDGGAECTGALSGGQGSCTLTLSTTGNRTLTAEYQGADGFARSSDTEDHTVTAPPAPILALTRQPSSNATLGVPFDQQPAVQLRTSDGADVTTAGVSVSAAIVSGGGTLVGTTTRITDASGRAEFTDLAITGDPGDRTLVFTASGFSSVNSGTISVQAPPPSETSTTITSADPNPSTAGAAVTVQFTVTSSGGTPTGSVSVSDGSDSCVGDLSGGAGSCSLTPTTAGAKTLTAQYTPADGSFAASSGTLAHQVDPAVSGVRAAGGASR
jgi:hypothetical protein